MNMRIDEPRGYCPTCGRTDYHADGCPRIKDRSFGTPPRQYRGLSGMQIFLLVLLAGIVVAVLILGGVL